MYAERAPAADLTGHLRCSWTRTAAGSGTVLPDGCLDLMWIGGQLVVAGPDTVATRSELAAGVEIAAVRFRPGAAPAVLGLPAFELRDQRVPLAEMWAGAGQLARRVDAAADRVAVLEAAVRRRLADAPPVDPVALAVARRLSAGPSVALPVARRRSDAPPVDPAALPVARRRSDAPPVDPAALAVARRLSAGPPVALAVAGRVSGAAGRVSGGAGRVSGAAGRVSGGAGVVSELARRAGLSERQLHRRCLAAFGYGPKTLERILRLQRFLALGRADPGAGLARLAADAGYADQAHLGHDCRALTGATPGELVAPSAAPIAA